MIKAKNKEHLKELIADRIQNFGDNCDLNDIDVSGITDMSKLFQDSKFNGDISEWNVSNVVNMYGMFENSQFNKDISKWDVSNATDMRWLFANSQFNGDISKWKVNCTFYITKNFDNYKFLPKNINGDIYFSDVINPKVILPLCMCDIKGEWDYPNVKNETLKKALSIMELNYKKHGFGEECLNETRNELISNYLEIYSYLEIEDLYFNYPHEFI